MYTFLLASHSLVRWAVVALAVAAVTLAWRGTVAGRPFDKRVPLAFVIALDVQLVLGLLLYFVSPLVDQALADMGAAMKVRGLRFWAVEHVTLVVAVLAFVHIGYRRTKHAADDKAKWRAAAIFFTIGLVLIAAAIPWPFLKEIGRPWLRF